MPADELLRLVNQDVSIYGVNDCRAFDAANPNEPDAGNPVSCPADREGRVEISYGGVFGTVSDDYWTDVEGRVACGMLDMDFDRSYLHGRFKPDFWVRPLDANATGARPILLDNLFCNGDENSLGKCPHPGWGIHNSLHSEDVAIRCVPRKFAVDLVPQAVDIRELYSITPQTISVYWTAREPSGIRRYRLQYASSANAPEGSWKTLWAEERVTQANYDDWPVPPGETRCYRVRAEYRGEAEDVLSTAGWPASGMCATAMNMEVSPSAAGGTSARSASDVSSRRSRRASGEEWRAALEIVGPPAPRVQETPSADGRVTFAVTTAQPFRVDYRVCYRTEDGTATAGADYVATEGEFVFAAGDNRRTVDVQLLNSGSGTFSLAVCDPSSGEVLARGEAMIGREAWGP